MAERCTEIFERLDSRCILKKGHKEKHAFPNALFKKKDPNAWKELRTSTTYWDNTPLPTILKVKGHIDNS